MKQGEQQMLGVGEEGLGAEQRDARLATASLEDRLRAPSLTLFLSPSLPPSLPFSLYLSLSFLPSLSPFRSFSLSLSPSLGVRCGADCLATATLEDRFY